jgi:glycosyltransferase involved in cell wall biosynthesis
LSGKLISVAMPVYNAEKYIAEAIESILAQSYSNLELIIVNDGSYDDSKKIILSYKDPRIKYFENESNLNIVKTRNRCISESSGDYIAVLDSDDIALPDRLEKQLEFLESNKEYGMCGTYYNIINTNNELLYRMNVPVTNRDIQTFLNFNICFCHSSVMMRTELAKKFKYKEGFDIIEDYELTYNVSKIAKIANLPFYSTLYRVHGNNVTIEKKDRMLALRKIMDESVLTDLGLYFTERELEIHSNFINFNYTPFKDDDQYTELENWLLKYYAFMKPKKQFNIRLITRCFTTRWILICLKNKKYNQIFFNRLVLKFNIFYFYYTALFIFDKFRNTHRVV